MTMLHVSEAFVHTGCSRWDLIALAIKLEDMWACLMYMELYGR